MSLFVVDRYEGDAAEEFAPKEDHLSALLKRIEARKRKREEGGERKPEKTNKQCQSTWASAKEDEELESERRDVPATKAVMKVEKKPRLEDSGFTVLGEKKASGKSRAVRRVLPNWLANPSIIPTELKCGMPLEEAESILDAGLIDNLKSHGVGVLFPVQERVIAWLLKCDRERRMGLWVRDCCVCAPTGSGKTLAYVLPILQILKSRVVRKVRCLIVLPGQELAAQVYKVALAYSAACASLKIGLVSGACSFEDEQNRIVRKTSNGEYESRVDVIVATPGRLVDHLEKTEGFSLDNLRFLVIDEADKASDWLRHIPAPHSRPPPLTLANLHSCNVPPAQKILLSATLSQDPEKLSRLGLLNPVLFATTALADEDDKDLDLDELQRYATPANLKERAIECHPEHKPLAVFRLLLNESSGENRPATKILVFTNSGISARRLAALLRILIKHEQHDENIAVKELSSMLCPKLREETLMDFAAGKFQVLVSSDALARGIDIPGVTLVVSYDPPKHLEGYIHRIGRTGRAGIAGTAISILTPNQSESFTRMLESARKTVPQSELEDFQGFAESIDYQRHLERLNEALLDKERRSENKRGPKS